MRLVVLFALLLNSCGAVKIADDPWCVDAGKYGAECFNAISNNEFSLNKYEWDKLRVGQVCSATTRPGIGYSNIKTSLEKLCADSRFCTVEQKEVVKSIGAKVERALLEGAGSAPFSK